MEPRDCCQQAPDQACEAQERTPDNAVAALIEAERRKAAQEALETYRAHLGGRLKAACEHNEQKARDHVAASIAYREMGESLGL